ncbi:hypothetical protein GCM10028895_51200 [Pontibacter rugosus]
MVVSTGYQRIPQERATGSFAQVSEATLQEQVSTDILSRLEAVASGVSVDRSRLTPELMVRGLSTINGPATPLIVVDNFPYEGDIGNLNPNDVESITVLKDAAAASIWGARAGNGVIVITTKKGRFNQPLTVGFNSSVSVSQEPDLSYLQQMKASDFIDVEQFLFEKGYYRGQLASSGRPVLSPWWSSWQPCRTGRSRRRRPMPALPPCARWTCATTLRGMSTSALSGSSMPSASPAAPRRWPGTSRPATTATKAPWMLVTAAPPSA